MVQSVTGTPHLEVMKQENYRLREIQHMQQPVTTKTSPPTVTRQQSHQEMQLMMILQLLVMTQ